MPKITYSAENIHCQKCASTIKNALEDEFGKIEVELLTEPKEVTVTLNSKDDEERFKNELEDIGFPVIEELKRD